MTALEQQREDQALGAAWRRAEAAVNEGLPDNYGYPWQLRLIGPFPMVGRERTYQAEWLDFDGRHSDEIGLADTPTAALEALIGAIEARKAASDG